MLDMGFRPAVDGIVARAPDRQTLLFSATLDGRCGKTPTRIPLMPSRTPRGDRAAPRRDRAPFRAGRDEAKVDRLVAELREAERGLTLVFVRTKRGADRLVKRLRAHSVEAVAMHGDKSQSQRQRALARFEAGHVDTLVATDVAARGIDVDGVTHVINYDAPDDRDAYVHRIGRTGRAGRTGIGVTFVLGDQARDIGRIAGDLQLEREFAEAGFQTTQTGPRRTSRPPQRGGNGSGRRRRVTR